jgi:hypothetical protein
MVAKDAKKRIQDQIGFLFALCDLCAFAVRKSSLSIYFLSRCPRELRGASVPLRLCVHHSSYWGAPAVQPLRRALNPLSLRASVVKILSANAKILRWQDWRKFAKMRPRHSDFVIRI